MKRFMRGCAGPVKEIVYPVKHNVVDCYSNETVKHVHPSHTTFVNHHLVRNEHIYPHSTSVKNTRRSVNVFGPRFGCQGCGAVKPHFCRCGKQGHFW